MQAPPRLDPLGRALTALSHLERRRLLDAVVTHEDGEWVDVESLLESTDDDTETGGVPYAGGRTASSDRGEVAARRCDRHLALVHRHLPKLDDGEYVDWDRSGGRFRRGPNFGQVASVLDALDANDGTLPAELL